MITLRNDKAGERGLICHISASGEPGKVSVEIVNQRSYGFPACRKSLWSLEEAKLYAQGFLDNAGQVEEWDDALAAMIGLVRPV